ncbi:unknown [Clostridium sp. CAG:354]|nr:unknown [Clostridium sp. CAG:354]HIT22790.1 hypothetical protein [Candidatus Faecimonas intestinavium]
MQNFIDDKEKMNDFKNLSKNEFLKSYSYLTEEEYDNTKTIYNSLLDKVKSYDETKIKQEELQTKLNKIENQILNMIPSNISKENFSNLINEIRYDYHAKDNRENREINMLNAFKQNNIKLCNIYLNKGVSPDRIFQYIRNVGYNNFCLDQQEFFNKYFKVKLITKEEFNNLYQKFENKQSFVKEELGKFLMKENEIYTTIDNRFGNLHTEDFKDRILALRYLNGEGIDKLRDEECRYEIGIYETKEDYEQGEPFQHNVVSDLNEAENTLNNLMKLNNYYSGFVLDQKTGIEEYAYYSDEQQEDEEEDEI